MRFLTMAALALLVMGATVARADDATKPKAKRAKPAATSDEKRRDLERRVDALERKYEMQYRETDSPSGAPGAEPAQPAEKPVVQ